MSCVCRKHFYLSSIKMYLVLLYLIVCTSVVHTQNLTYLGSLPAEAPGFPTLYDHGEVSDPTERYSILYSSFYLFGPGFVSFLKHPGKCLDAPDSCSLERVDEGYMWPREARQVPDGVFQNNSYIHVPDGFVVPGSRDGGLYITDMSDGSRVQIGNAEGDPDWFYQRAYWKDADGDGLMDIFTCRTNVPVGSFSSQFLWFKNPGDPDAPRTGPWEIGHVISQDDCDTFFVETTLTVEGVEYNVFFSTGYFHNKLSVHWNAEALWDNSTQISSRVVGSLIDDADCVPGVYLCGHYFDLMLRDFNNDGRLDMMVTINSNNYGHLVVYEIPDDFRTDNFEPIKIAEGFVPRTDDEDAGSPGLLQSFYPTPDSSGKPWLGLTGDDDGRSYYLYPVSEDPDSWQYELVPFYDGGEDQIMGGPLVFDANGDGYPEFFQLLYSMGEIQFYTFNENLEV